MLIGNVEQCSPELVKSSRVKCLRKNVSHVQLGGNPQRETEFIQVLFTAIMDPTLVVFVASGCANILDSLNCGFIITEYLDWLWDLELHTIISEDVANEDQILTAN